MTEPRRSSIQGTLWLGAALAVLFTVLGAGLLYLHQLRQGRHESGRLRILTMAETYAAQMIPFAAVGRRSDIVAFVDGVKWHPGTSLMAVLDMTGAVIAARGNTALIEQYVMPARNETPSMAVRTWQIPGSPDRRMPAQGLAAVPLHDPQTRQPLGVLVYAARPAAEERVDWSRVSRHLLGLLAASFLGVALASYWLGRRIQRPLHELAERASSLGTVVDGRFPAGLTGRSDEIGVVSRAVATLCSELRGTRDQAGRLERSLDHRVAAETKQIARELRQAEKKIWTDPLTRLGNRRMMDEKFEEIFRAQVEAGQDLSVVLIDLDYFKEVNDSLGHKTGDELLVLVGELLRQCLRDQDLAIRYGGDEFILILPSVSAANALAIAEGTIRLFTQQTRVLKLRPSPGMSAGIASLRVHHPSDSSTLLDLADQALYDAKRSGKSQVRICREPAAV